MSTTVVACQTSNTRNADSDQVHKQERATLDGDNTVFDDGEDFYGRIRASSLNGHNLNVYPSGKAKGQRFSCTHRNCRLDSGQHSIDLEFLWGSLAAEKKRRSKERWQGLAIILAPFGGVAPPTPDSSRYYPCRALITFEVQASHDYALDVLHSNRKKEPEEFQIVDITTGAVVGRTRPVCDEYFIPAAAPVG
jgi:hypothetical protein